MRCPSIPRRRRPTAIALDIYCGSAGGTGTEGDGRRERRLSDGSTQIGNLVISPRVLGHGSSTHGTVVFAGTFGGRRVAVKRVLAQFNEIAEREVEALIRSDEHPNVLRCFAWERSGDFMYLALERCSRTLYDALSPEGRERPEGEGGGGGGSEEDAAKAAAEELDDAALWAIALDAVQGVHVRIAIMLCMHGQHA